MASSSGTGPSEFGWVLEAPSPLAGQSSLPHQRHSHHLGTSGPLPPGRSRDADVSQEGSVSGFGQRCRPLCYFPRKAQGRCLYVISTYSTGSLLPTSVRKKKKCSSPLSSSLSQPLCRDLGKILKRAFSH